MIILKPTEYISNQSQIQEEYRVVIKSDVEYFYKHCPVCGHETSWCPIQNFCEQCGS